MLAKLNDQNQNGKIFLNGTITKDVFLLINGLSILFRTLVSTFPCFLLGQQLPWQPGEGTKPLGI